MRYRKSCVTGGDALTGISPAKAGVPINTMEATTVANSFMAAPQLHTKLSRRLAGSCCRFSTVNLNFSLAPRSAFGSIADIRHCHILSPLCLRKRTLAARRDMSALGTSRHRSLLKDLFGAIEQQHRHSHGERLNGVNATRLRWRVSPADVEAGGSLGLVGQSLLDYSCVAKDSGRIVEPDDSCGYHMPAV